MLLSANRQKNYIEASNEILPDEFWIRLYAWPKLYPFGVKLLKAAVHNSLFELEVRDAVAQKSADAIGFLEHDDVDAGADGPDGSIGQAVVLLDGAHPPDITDDHAAPPELAASRLELSYFPRSGVWIR